MESYQKMRIISGSFKGRSIKFLKNSNTRPLKDSVRENIFNILEHSHTIKPKIKNSNILDLYSGIGSFGIECIQGSKINYICRSRCKCYQNFKGKFDLFINN